MLDLEQRRGGGGCFACPAGFSSFHDFFLFTPNKGVGSSPPEAPLLDLLLVFFMLHKVA